MSPQLIVTLLVFAPLAGAVIAGLFGRRIGDKPSQGVTTVLLFLACACAWSNFYSQVWGQGEPFTIILK
ncbi:MAG TPA: hypothetical protein VHX64_09660, partial [Caulobacteraceae bacterium]|nr:hypothetical protein [Caulobacteraceae bacterium]